MILERHGCRFKITEGTIAVNRRISRSHSLLLLVAAMATSQLPAQDIDFRQNATMGVAARQVLPDSELPPLPELPSGFMDADLVSAESNP